MVNNTTMQNTVPKPLAPKQPNRPSSPITHFPNNTSSTEKQQEVQQKIEDVNQTKMVTVQDSKVNEKLEKLDDAIQDVEELKQLNESIIKQREKEFQDYNEAIIDKLNKLYESTNGLRVKIEHSGTYEKYIEERLKSTSLEHDVVMLQSQLDKEKNEFFTFINSARSKIEDLKTTDDMINKSITEFITKLTETYEKYIENVDTKLSDFGKEVQEKYSSIYEALKLSSQKLISEYVSNCKQNTDTMKNAAIDFLKDCQAHNTELIKKIPVVNASKYNFKEILLYILSITSILSLLVNILTRLFC